MNDENYILQHIEALCEKHKWSHYTLSLKSGLSQSTISNLFNRTNQPTFTTLYKICNAFEITLAQFFDSANCVDLTRTQEEIILMYNMLSDIDKDIVKLLLKSLSDKKN